MTTITSKNQPKPLTERQIWACWNQEYNRSKRSGFSNNESINRADTLVREKRQERDALINEAETAEQ